MKLYKGTCGDFADMPKNFLAADSRDIDYWTDSREVAELYGPVILEKTVDIPLDATVVDCDGRGKSCSHVRTAMLDSLRRAEAGLDPAAPIVFINIVDTPEGEKVQPHIVVGFKRESGLAVVEKILKKRANHDS